MLHIIYETYARYVSKKFSIINYCVQYYCIPAIWLQGLGLYATKDLEMHTMVIEYIGDLIRNEVANRREKTYESQVNAVFLLILARCLLLNSSMNFVQITIWQLNNH